MNHFIAPLEFSVTYWIYILEFCILECHQRAGLVERFEIVTVFISYPSLMQHHMALHAFRKPVFYLLETTNVDFLVSNKAHLAMISFQTQS